MNIAQSRHDDEILVVSIDLKLTVRIDTDDFVFLDFDLFRLKLFFEIYTLTLNNHSLSPFPSIRLL